MKSIIILFFSVLFSCSAFCQSVGISPYVGYCDFLTTNAADKLAKNYYSRLVYGFDVSAIKLKAVDFVAGYSHASTYGYFNSITAGVDFKILRNKNILSAGISAGVNIYKPSRVSNDPYLGGSFNFDNSFAYGVRLIYRRTLSKYLTVNAMVAPYNTNIHNNPSPDNTTANLFYYYIVAGLSFRL